MGVGRPAEMVTVVSESECWFCLLQQTVKIMQGIFLERHEIVQIVGVEKKNKTKKFIKITDNHIFKIIFHRKI
jgi:hypothetical protein